jgi:hypothetical protein
MQQGLEFGVYSESCTNFISAVGGEKRLDCLGRIERDAD